MMSQRDKSELVRRRNAQEQTQGQLSYEASAWPEQAQPPLWEEKGRWLGLGRLTGFQEHTARPVLPKAPGVWKYATLQNLTLDEL